MSNDVWPRHLQQRKRLSDTIVPPLTERPQRRRLAVRPERQRIGESRRAGIYRPRRQVNRHPFGAGCPRKIGLPAQDARDQLRGRGLAQTFEDRGAQGFFAGDVDFARREGFESDRTGGPDVLDPVDTREKGVVRDLRVARPAVPLGADQTLRRRRLRGGHQPVPRNRDGTVRRSKGRRIGDRRENVEKTLRRGFYGHMIAARPDEPRHDIAGKGPRDIGESPTDARSIGSSNGAGLPEPNDQAELFHIALDGRICAVPGHEGGTCRQSVLRCLPNGPNAQHGSLNKSRPRRADRHAAYGIRRLCRYLPMLAGSNPSVAHLQAHAGLTVLYAMRTTR